LKEKWQGAPQVGLGEMSQMGMCLIGGVHTNMAIRELQQEYAAGHIGPLKLDRRWWAWPCKIYALPSSLDDFAEALQVLGNEDNQKYLMETPFPDRYRTCYDVFLREFANEKGVWASKEVKKRRGAQFVNRCLIHAHPRTLSNAQAMAALACRSPDMQKLIWKIVTGDYKLPESGTLHSTSSFLLCF